MSKPKSKYKDIMASARTEDNFGTIFESMLVSKAYQDLSLGAKQFYTLCRVQARSIEGKRCLYMHKTEEETATYNNNCFVFPAKHLSKYNIKRPNANRYFNELQQAGFIKKREANQHRYKVNVYEFSDGWKNTS